MKISSFCIKHKVMTVLSFIMIAVFGLVSFTMLKMSLMPNMDIPAAVVMCTYVGATPEDVEELVIRDLESAVASVSGVESISSTSSENVGIVMIEYTEDTDVDIAANKLREKFELLTLPDGCSEPTIINMNVSDMMPVSVIALSGDDLIQLQSLAEDTIGPALERLSGVASVDVIGGITSEIAVEVNTSALAGYGLSLSDVSNYLAAANLLYPAGDVQNGTNVLTATTNGKYQTVDDVANTIIFLPTGGSLRLSEIANVYLDTELEGSAAKVDGKDAVVLSVSKRSGANEVEICRDIQHALADLKADRPSMEYAVVYESSEFIMQTVSSAIQNIVLGVLLSAAVVFLFLRQAGSTITISLSMPFCVLAVFLLMNALGLSMNMMSLGGIALCIGMIVDNSIVVLENINRYAADGHSKYDSCVLGTAEVTNSVIASTTTTICVFLPIALSGGMAGQLFIDFSLTVVCLLVASLFCALTLVPLMCYFLLDEHAVRLQKLQGGRKEDTKWSLRIKILSEKYMRTLQYFLEHRRRAVLISIGLVIVCLASCLTTNLALIPSMDQGTVNVSVEMPTGTELDDTLEYSERVVTIIQENCPELDSIYLTIGGNAAMGGSSESASIVANLVSKDDRDRSSDEVGKSLKPLFQNIAGCEITVSSADMMASMTGGSDLQINVSGDDHDVLASITDDLTAQIAALPDATEITNSMENKIPTVKIDVNHSAAAQYGLTAATIGSAVRSDLTGTEATTITINGDEMSVVVTGNGINAESLDALRSMSISTPMGSSVPLSSVANVFVELAPQSISRTDQVRQLQITGNCISGDTNAFNTEVQALIDAYPMPEGYQADIGGSQEMMMENFQSLFLAMGVAICLVYFVLAVQFESFLMPLMVMMILPMSLAGGLFGLPLTRMDFSIIVMLALIMLVGTVVNSSIVLVDYINIRRANGMEKNEAILTACPLRVRPILMTTLTTVLALIPMAVSNSEGNEMLQPLGIVMIFGMMISTVVTLLFTPVFYSLLDSLSERISRPFKEKKAQKAKVLLAQIAAAEAALSDNDPT